MTLRIKNADNTFATLLTYEQAKSSFPWPQLRKTILVRSDSEMLSQDIVASLEDICHESPFRHGATDMACREADLIITASSDPNVLPVVALTRPDIARQVGKIPIVILSQHPFDSQGIRRIHCLPLPIQPAVLRAQVLALLT